MDLNSGILRGRASSLLEKAGWTDDESAGHEGAVVVAAVPPAFSPPGDARLASLLEACGGDLESCLTFPEGNLRRWVACVGRIFIEIFRGQGFLSVAVSSENFPVAPGIDRDYPSYGQNWDLTLEAHRRRLRWLLSDV